MEVDSTIVEELSRKDIEEFLHEEIPKVLPVECLPENVYLFGSRYPFSISSICEAVWNPQKRF